MALWRQLGGRQCSALLRLRLRRAAAPIGQRLYASEAPPKNPFEIQFHPTAEDALFGRKLPTANARTAREVELESEIDSLHAEMAGIFGEEPEEYDDGGSSSKADDAFASEQTPATAFDGEALTAKAAWGRPSGRQEGLSLHSARLMARTEDHEGGAGDDILLLQGPCSYMRDTAIGCVRVKVATDKRKHELLGELEAAAAQIGANVRCRDSNLEGDILEWLLSADAGSSIVLCWNSRLSESPLVLRALQALDSDVVVVSPLGVEHGPLPASVRGVIS
ncbi:hypothetical protein PybrP1_004535, partial [[Pythium] brassicae (nom. inval.)]